MRNVAIDESPTTLQARLHVPRTAAERSAHRRERGDAAGSDRRRPGQARSSSKAVESNDPEVRFYAAEALAYLDDTAAVDALADVARDEPAFRVNALAALSAMDDVMAYDALRDRCSK